MKLHCQIIEHIRLRRLLVNGNLRARRTDTRTRIRIRRAARHLAQSRSTSCAYTRLSAVAPQFEIQEGKVCLPYTRLSFPRAGRFRNRRNEPVSPPPPREERRDERASERASAYEPRRKKNATLARFHRRSLSRETFAMRRRLREIYLRPRHVAPPLPSPLPPVPRKPGLIG